MSGHGGGESAFGGAMKDLLYFIAFIIFLWFVWLYFGGADSVNKDKPFSKPDFIGLDGEVYGPADAPPTGN